MKFRDNRVAHTAIVRDGQIVEGCLGGWGKWKVEPPLLMVDGAYVDGEYVNHPLPMTQEDLRGNTNGRCNALIGRRTDQRSSPDAARVRPVGRIYLECGKPVIVLIQWGLKSRGESYGGPRNVLILRESGEVVVRPFRGLRPAYTSSRGNKIPRFAGRKYLDTEARALLEEFRMRPCGFCGQQFDAPFDGHDPCIADLPGVGAACCGHGAADEGIFDACYVLFADGLRLGGNAARAAMRMLGGDPPDAPPGATARVGEWVDLDLREWRYVAEFGDLEEANEPPDYYWFDPSGVDSATS